MAAIAKLSPVKLKVHVRDGDPQVVPVPDNRKRLDLIRRTLESLDWERVECLGKNGELLGPVITRDVDDDEEEFYEDEASGEGIAALLRGVLRDAMKTNLEIMRTTMKETRQIFDAQTKSQSELVGVMVEGLRAVQESYSIAMRVQTAQLVSGGGAQGDSEMGDMMKMAAMMMLKGGAPPPMTPTPPRPAAPPARPPINVPPKQESKP